MINVNASTEKYWEGQLTVFQDHLLIYHLFEEINGEVGVPCIDVGQGWSHPRHPNGCHPGLIPQAQEYHPGQLIIQLHHLKFDFYKHEVSAFLDVATC